MSNRLTLLNIEYVSSLRLRCPESKLMQHTATQQAVVVQQ